MPKKKKEVNVATINVVAKPARARKASSPKNPNFTPLVETIKQLNENTTQLQQVFTEIGIKLDKLTEQTAGLLGLFESAAKSFAEAPSVHTAERDKEFISKINQLLEQDKIIAKGILYIEDRVNEMSKESAPLQPLPTTAYPQAAPQAPQPLQPIAMEIPSAPSTSQAQEGFAPSIAQMVPPAPQSSIQERKPVQPQGY